MVCPSEFVAEWAHQNFMLTSVLKFAFPTFPQFTINYLIQLKSPFYLTLKDEPHSEATIIGLYDVLLITTRIMRAGKRLHTVSYILSQIDNSLLHDILYVRKVKYTYIFWYSACL